MSRRRNERRGERKALHAVVISVGEELLNGFIVNSNATWLGQRLTAAGCTVSRVVTVGDDPQEIARHVGIAATEADLVVLTGGLGPTSDDRTREAVALAVGVDLEREPAAEAWLRERLTSMGSKAPEALLVQVDLPAGATPIRNAAGTAPGFKIPLGEALVVALPGPPTEMHQVATSGLMPEIVRRRAWPVVTRSLRTALVPESVVHSLVEPLRSRHSDITVAYLAAPSEVVVRLTIAGPDEKRLNEQVDAAAEDVREALGEAFVGDADLSLAQAVVGLLAKAGRTVAIGESLTGGAVASAMTGVTGASVVLLGGVVAYSPEAKRDVLGVDADLLETHGTVHAGVAREMAARVREKFGADYGIGTTGVAGPDPSDGQPVGRVHVAVCGPASTIDVTMNLLGDRALVRRQTVVHSLDLLRRSVLGLPPHQGLATD